MTGWGEGDPGVLLLPSGRRVRGRALRRPVPPGEPPQLTVALLGRAPRRVPWELRWVRWPDLLLPADPSDAEDALREAWRRAPDERVEVACRGGRGRTGTALACLLVLDGLPATEALAQVRARYDRRAVETPWQRRWVLRFPPNGAR